MMRFIEELLIGWLYHMNNMVKIFSSKRKIIWLSENLNSVIVFVLTFLVILFIILTYRLEWGTYEIPTPSRIPIR